jgi:hypothetical protein
MSDFHPPDDRGLKLGGTIAILLIGSVYVACGTYTQHTGMWSNRPLRPYMDMTLGFAILAMGIADLVRRWRKNRN